MRRWEKILFIFFMGLILLVFVWSIVMIDRVNSSGFEELREPRTTESMSIGRISKED